SQFYVHFPCHALLSEDGRGFLAETAADGSTALVLLTDDDLIRRYRDARATVGVAVPVADARQLRRVLKAVPAHVTHVTFDPSPDTTMTPGGSGSARQRRITSAPWVSGNPRSTIITCGRTDAARANAAAPVRAVIASNPLSRNSAASDAAASSPSSTTRTRPPPRTGMARSVAVMGPCQPGSVWGRLMESVRSREGKGNHRPPPAN